MIDLLVNWTVYFKIEYIMTEDNEVFDKIIDEVCVLNQIFVWWYGT